MDIDKMTIGEFKSLAALFNGGQKTDDSHWEVGQTYLIRTVTMYDTGRLVRVTPIELVLEDAAWISDTGRFHEALVDPSKFKEVEPFPSGMVIINRASIIDAVKISSVPRSAK